MFHCKTWCAYTDSSFRNINREAVLKRIEAARNDQPLPNEDPLSTKDTSGAT